MARVQTAIDEQFVLAVDVAVFDAHLVTSVAKAPQGRFEVLTPTCFGCRVVVPSASPRLLDKLVIAKVMPSVGLTA